MFSLVCISKEGIKFYEIKGRCTRESPKVLEKQMTMNVLVSSIPYCHPLFSHGHSPR